MMKQSSKRILALLLLFATITSLVVSFGENVVCAGELPGAHEASSSSFAHDQEQLHDGSCPHAPAPSHTPDDHFCVGDCGCPCQAPLYSVSVFISYSPISAFLYHTEPTRHIPEVYLSLFVPPDSATV